MELAVQCYTLRDVFATDPWGTFKKVYDIGLRNVELAGLYGHSAQEVADKLGEIGLKAFGSHCGLDDLENNLDKVVADHQILGVKYLTLPWISDSVVEMGWDAFGKRCEAIAKNLPDGMIFSYHNHAFEFKKGRYEDLWETTDPELLKAQLDLGWIYNAGRDPVQWLRMLSGRVPTVHLKDFTDNPDSLDAVAGEGRLDWDAILPTCTGAGVEYGVIEMDVPPGDPVECVERCYKFFAAKV